MVETAAWVLLLTRSWKYCSPHAQFDGVINKVLVDEKVWPLRRLRLVHAVNSTWTPPEHLSAYS